MYCSYTFIDLRKYSKSNNFSTNLLSKPANDHALMVCGNAYNKLVEDNYTDQ